MRNITRKMNNINRLFTLLLVFSIINLSAPHVTYSKTISSNTNYSLENISIARSDDIQWVFKEIDGKLYKRLYNYTTHEWIGDWILVG